MVSKRQQKITELYDLMEELSEEHEADEARISEISEGIRIELDFHPDWEE